MNQTRDNYISQLVADLPQGSKPIHINRWLSVWLLCSWLFVLFAMLIVGSFRPQVLQQLSEHPRFLLETVVGLVAVVAMSVVALRSAIPAGLVKPLVWFSAGTFLLWFANYVFALYVPTMESSMSGKRVHCAWETLLYGLPPLFLGLWLINRGYVLNRWSSGLSIGIAAGFIPAWFMQLGCMYDAKHTLLLHMGPALLLTFVALGLSWIWLRADAR